jgi:uncharacterized integral membrane protein
LQYDNFLFYSIKYELFTPQKLRESIMATLKFISILILLALVAIFTYQNTEPVSLNFFLSSKSMSLSLLLLGFLFAGIIIGWIFFSFYLQKKRAPKR